MSIDQFVQYVIQGLTDGSIYALVGLGFTIIYAVTRIINFAQGEFLMIGGMLSYTLSVSAGLSIPLSLLIAVLAAAAIGAIMYLLAIRSARRASVISLIIITIGFSIFVRGVAAEIWGVTNVRPQLFSGKNPLSLPFVDAVITPQAIWIIGTVILITLLVHLFLKYTMVGKALKACAINPQAAGLVGINSRAMALIAFVMAAIIGGFSGVVISPHILASYDMGVMLGLKGFVAASIGGFKNPIATVAGGVMLGLVENVAVGINWGPFTSSYKHVIALVVLLLILLIRSGRLASEERAA
ncbi:MAG: branched-chain amino acid ABC transporter permease [Dehalococcoidia bacterium]|jgi:branched-chain amino acid transport system permease protein